MIVQLLVGLMALAVFVLCFDHVRQTHPKTDDPLAWALAVVFCIAAVFVAWAVVEQRASLSEALAMAGALSGIVAIRHYRREAHPACVSTPRALQPLEFPFVHGGKR